MSFPPVNEEMDRLHGVETVPIELMPRLPGLFPWGALAFAGQLLWGRCMGESGKSGYRSCLRALDLGCGIGGPLPEMARFSGAEFVQ